MSREKALAAPDKILEFIPRSQPRIKGKNLIWAKQIAKKYLDAKK